MNSIKRGILACCVTVLVAAAATTTTVMAAPITAGVGPITAAQCSIVNPNPTITSCAGYPVPTTRYYTSLPYSTVPEYADCVVSRCHCTYYALPQDTITASSLYCDGLTSFLENGTTTCNEMTQCFREFYTCVNDALVARYIANPSLLDPAETAMMNAIITHGTTPGQDFKSTDLYLDCQLTLCEAADNRQVCGLQTCIPNYGRACHAYMRPPPDAFRRYKCTQGCQAGLMLMALTIAFASAAFTCMFCCPAVVKEKPPVLDMKKKKDEEKRSGTGSAKTHQSSSSSSKKNQ